MFTDRLTSIGVWDIRAGARSLTEALVEMHAAVREVEINKTSPVVARQRHCCINYKGHGRQRDLRQR